MMEDDLFALQHQQASQVDHEPGTAQPALVNPLNQKLSVRETTALNAVSISLVVVVN